MPAEPAVAVRGTAAAPEARPPGGPNRPLRVLWLIKGLGAGGAERLLVLAAREADRRRHHVEAAYLLPWKDALVPDLERAGVRVHCLRAGPEWDLRWGLRLRTLLVRGRFDVVHVHSPYVAGIARLVVRTLPRRPAVVSTEHLPWQGYVALTRALNALTYRLDDAHLAVSAAVRDSIPRPVRGGVRVIVHGIPVEEVAAERRHRAAARRELGVRDGEVLIGTVANMRPQKGYPHLLAAARRVLDAGLPARFVAVGTGAIEGEIARLHLALGLGERFRLLGYREDAVRILAACDAFVLASLFEGLPVAMMEALALGLPVVATSVPGIRGEVVHGREAILVPPADPGRLADAIAEVVRRPELRARMAEAALARAPAFDIARAVRRTEAAYRDVVATRSGRRGLRR